MLPIYVVSNRKESCHLYLQIKLIGFDCASLVCENKQHLIVVQDQIHSVFSEKYKHHEINALIAYSVSPIRDQHFVNIVL